MREFRWTVWRSSLGRCLPTRSYIRVCLFACISSGSLTDPPPMLTTRDPDPLPTRDERRAQIRPPLAGEYGHGQDRCRSVLVTTGHLHGGARSEKRNDHGGQGRRESPEDR